MSDAQQEQKPEKKKNMGMIFQIALAVVNLSMSGGGAYLVYASTIGWHAPVINEETLEKESLSNKEDVAESYIYTMDKFTVNLGGEPKRTIRLEVNIETLGKDGFEEIINTENRAKARDQIVRILNEQSFSDIESIQGKLFLKDKIASEMNSLLTKGIVKDVYFTDFVVQ